MTPVQTSIACEALVALTLLGAITAYVHALVEMVR
jgi:hypothetical protein